MKIFFTLFLCCKFFFVTAQWNNNPAVNNLIASTPGDDYLTTLISDGAGGSIHFFNIGNDDVYAQKISAMGVLQWGGTTNPVKVCDATNQQEDIVAIPDGSGGAFVAWSDYRHSNDSGEIYIQHISATGLPLWAANGQRITTSLTIDDYGPGLCADGSGGVIVSWSRDNNIDDIQVFAQRINSAGTMQWVSNGVQVCTAPGFRVGNTIVSDGSNGFISIFVDSRNDPNGLDYDYLSGNELTNGDIYAQRINGNGNRLWTNNGVAVCTAGGNQGAFEFNTAIPDGNGGVMFAYDDGRNDVLDINGDPTNNDMYVQKLNNNGVSQWAQNGVPVSNAGGNQFITNVSTDGSGGIVVLFENFPVNTMYAQRVISTGTVAWAVNGIAVTAPGQNSYDAKITADGAGNIIVAYIEDITKQLRAQKLGSTGTFLWGTGGVSISNTGSNQRDVEIVASGNGSAIASWSDSRILVSTNTDVFASKILSTGVLDGIGTTTFVTAANGNWNSPSTWVGGVVPTINAVVTVKHNVTVTANATCKSLKVETASGRVTVKTGLKLTVTN